MSRSTSWGLMSWNDPFGHGCPSQPCSSLWASLFRAGLSHRRLHPRGLRPLFARRKVEFSLPRRCLRRLDCRRPVPVTAGWPATCRRRCRILRRPVQRGRRCGSNGAQPTGHGPDAQARAARADRLPVPDQPGHGAAALRRPAADRGRGAGQRLGRRGRAHAGQGPLGPHAQHRLRLHPPRRRRPGLQQGHHDRAERQLLLRRCRPVGNSSPTTDAIFQPLAARQVLNAAALGHPDGQERRPAADRRRLLPGPPVPRACTPAPSTPSSGATTWSSGSPA